MAHRSTVGLHATADQDFAGVDADAHSEAGNAVASLQFLSVTLRCREDREPGSDRAFGVVLADLLAAESGLQSVAGVAQHATAGGVDEGAKTAQCFADDRQRILGI